MNNNEQDFLRQVQEAGASKVIVEFNNDRTQSNHSETNKDAESNNLSDLKKEQEQSEETTIYNNENENRFPWREIYFDALKYNKKVDAESIDSDQHIDDNSVEVLRELLESKIVRKSKCESIYKDLAYLTNYLYDTYDYNYIANGSERDPEGDYVYNIEKGIIEGVKKNYSRINLEETKQIIEAISETFGDKNKVDDHNFVNVISKIACDPRGKDILEIVLQFMDKFECIDKPSHLKEFVNKIVQIVNKHGDISVLNNLVLAIEENDISKDTLMKKILQPILDLKKDEYEKLKKDRVFNNDGILCEISVEDLKTLIENYKIPTVKKVSKVKDIVKEQKNKRRLKNSPKNIGVDRKFRRMPILILGAAGVIAAFLSVKTLFNKNSNSLKNTSAEIATELEIENEVSLEDTKPEMPDVLQEDNKKYYIVKYTDPISKESKLVYLQMDRDEYEIPKTDNVIITEDGVIENVDKYEITPVLTRMRIIDNSVIDITDDIKIEDGSYIDVLFYNPQCEKEGEYHTCFYNDGENIYTSTISEKKLKKMEIMEYTMDVYNDGKNEIPLFTFIPTFLTNKDEITISEQEGDIIPRGMTFLGSKEITADGEKIDVIGIIPEEQSDNQPKIMITTIEGEETVNIESSIDKYKKEEMTDNITQGYAPVGEYTLDDNIDQLYVYPSTNIDGIPEYIFGEGVHIILCEHSSGYTVEDDNEHFGNISIEDGERIKDLIAQQNEQENSTDVESEEEHEDENNEDENNEEEYIEESEEELTSFDALEEEWTEEEIEY